MGEEDLGRSVNDFERSKGMGDRNVICLAQMVSTKMTVLTL